MHACYVQTPLNGMTSGLLYQLVCLMTLADRHEPLLSRRKLGSQKAAGGKYLQRCKADFQGKVDFVGFSSNSAQQLS